MEEREMCVFFRMTLSTPVYRTIVDFVQTSWFSCKSWCVTVQSKGFIDSGGLPVMNATVTSPPPQTEQ